jgi:hypothetical protein
MKGLGKHEIAIYVTREDMLSSLHMTAYAKLTDVVSKTRKPTQCAKET